MMVKGISIVLLLFLCFSNVACASNFDIVRPDKEDWSCVDYSVDYARKHEGWGIVTISNNMWFRGSGDSCSHMVNYKIDGDTIILHDEMRGYETTGHNWYKDETTFFHFWNDESEVKRVFKFLTDNREVVLCQN